MNVTPEGLELWWPHIARALATLIILWQTLVDDLDRPYLLSVAVGLFGLKWVVDVQRSRNGRGTG